MRFYKLRPQGHGTSQAASYNTDVNPETVPAFEDNDEVEWIDPAKAGPRDHYVGEQVSRSSIY